MELTWMPGNRANGWQNLSFLDRRLALLETIAHLEFMRTEGKVDKSTRDTLIYYTIAGIR